MSWNRITPSHLALGLSVVVLVSLAPAIPVQAKVKDNCRRITIEGTAGDVTEVATWRIYDKASPAAALLAESCAMQPLPNESNLDYIRRLAYRWGDNPTCPQGDALLNPLEETNKCVDLGSKSCKIKYKIAPKTDGAKKRYLEFCCYDDNVCKDKLVLPDPIPITVVVDRDGLPTPCPAEDCVDNCSDCTVDVDPIAMRNLPTGPGADCRDKIAKAISKYTAAVTEALTDCHDAIAAGTIAPATDCNSVSGDPTTVAAIDAVAYLIDDATTACGSTRTPEEMGYVGFCEEPCSPGDVACIRPCASINVTTWPLAADCLRCRAQTSAEKAIETVYGSSETPPSLVVGVAPQGRSVVSETAQDCLAAVGKAVTQTVSVRAKQAAKCQKKVDAGMPLPPDVTSCGESDPKEVIRRAEDKANDIVTSSCDTTAVNDLNLCDDGEASDADGLANCVTEAAEELNETIVEAAVPTGGEILLKGRDLEYVSAIYDANDGLYSPPQPLGAYGPPPPPGALRLPGLFAVNDIAVSPEGKNVYTVSWVNGDKHRLNVFDRDLVTGELLPIDFEEYPTTPGMLHVSTVVVSPDGKHVYAANQAPASTTGVSLFNRDPNSGALSFVALYGQSSEFVGANSMVISADGKNIYVVSVGTDTCSDLDQLRVFDRDPDTGTLTLTQTFTNGVDGVEGINTPFNVAVAPDGKNVYVAAFPIRTFPACCPLAGGNYTGTGFGGTECTPDEPGVCPVADPVCELGACRVGEVCKPADDEAFAIFDRDAATGHLTFNSAVHRQAVGPPYLARPTAVAVSGDNRFLYVASFDQDVNVFRRDPLTGSLTWAEQLPSIGGPQHLVVSPNDERIYAESWRDALSVYERNLATGKHSLLETELDDRDAPSIRGMVGIAVSPDGRDVYTGSYYDHALTHFRVRCGNGVTELGEACDDGNVVAGDGCSSDCRYEKQ